MNKCMFVGRFTRDPELKQLNNSKVVNFTLAINRVFKKANGEKQEETAFARFEAFDTGAETIHKFFKKGKAIIISDATFRTRNYDDKDGNKKSISYFRVNNFEFPPRDSEVENVNETNETPEVESNIPF